MIRVDSPIGKRRRAPRAIAVSAAAMIGLCAVGQSSTAFAQQSSAPVLDFQPSPTGVWPAPVGHRQPTRTDLPPSERHDEGAITPGQRQFDSSLNICRNC